MTIGAVTVLMVTTGAILIGCHSSVVLVSSLLSVRLEAEPVPGVSVGSVGHPGVWSLSGYNLSLIAVRPGRLELIWTCSHLQPVTSTGREQEFLG